MTLESSSKVRDDILGGFMTKKKEDDKIKLESYGYICVLTIMNDEKHNSFHDALLDAFVNKIDTIESQVKSGAVRAMILTGEGVRSFCSGYDISCIDPEQPDHIPLPDVRFERAVLAIKNLSAPVIAALNGDAFGGGFDLAMSCDIAIAREGVKLAMTPCKLGLIYSKSGLSRFVSRLGAHTSRRIFFTGDVIHSDEAKELRIIDEIVPEEKLMNHCMELAQTIANNAPLAVQGTKHLINELVLNETTISPELEQLRWNAFRSNDLKLFLAAFKNRSKPTFNGN